MRIAGLFIDGKRPDGKTAREIKSPFTGEAVARCFDLPPGAAYDLVILRPYGEFEKEMLPEDLG